jgi:TonB family protein
MRSHRNPERKREGCTEVRIGLEARLYWKRPEGPPGGGRDRPEPADAPRPFEDGSRPGQLLESVVVERGEVRLVDRQGTRPRYLTGGRLGTPVARLEDGRALVTAPPGRVVEVRRGEDERWTGPVAVLGPGAVARVADGPLVHEFRLAPVPARATGGLAPDLGLARRLVMASLVAAAVVAATFVPFASHRDLADEPLSVKFLRVVHALPPRPVRPPLRIERPEEPSFHSRTTAPGVGVGRRGGGTAAGSPLVAMLAGLGDGGGVFTSGMGAGINDAVNALRGSGTGGPESLHGLAALGPRGGFGLPDGGFGIGSLTGGGGPGHGPVLFTGGGAERQAVRVNPGKIVVRGGLSKEVIGKTIRSRERQVVDCYQRELQKEPSLEGKLAVSFVIDGNGHVAEVSVMEDSLGTPAVAECVKARILRWRFPAPDGGGQVLVRYPWIFRAAGE